VFRAREPTLLAQHLEQAVVDGGEDVALLPVDVQAETELGGQKSTESCRNQFRGRA
jgi:hypothetical protein